jgi:thioredoxin 1
VKREGAHLRATASAGADELAGALQRVLERRTKPLTISTEPSAGKNVIELTDANFDAEVLKSDVPVLVDFTATWCGPCKVLAPIVEGLADEFAGKYKIGKLDIDDAPGITQKYGVRGVPTVMVFKGGEKKAQHVGVTNKDTLIKLLES